MRVPYVDNPPKFDNEADNAVVSRVQARRGERGLIPVDLALLHSPPVADGWNSFLGAIRTGTSLPAAILELAICRVAALNAAWYEWDAHAPLLQRADPGLYTPAVLEYVRCCPTYTGHRNESGQAGSGELIDTPSLSADGNGESGKSDRVDAAAPRPGLSAQERLLGAADAKLGLGERELAVLAYTDAMTRGVAVPERVWARLRAAFGERACVEITAAVAAYNCVSRFLVALDVGEKNGTG